jgi:hypothetical protein
MYSKNEISFLFYEGMFLELLTSWTLSIILFLFKTQHQPFMGATQTFKTTHA